MADRREDPASALDSEAPREPVRGSIKSADRTIQLLELLADSDHSLTFTEIHKLLGVPKSSLSGLLQTLRGRGWVETRDRGHTYGIGLRALRVGTEYLDRDPVVAASASVLTELRRSLDETIHLARLDGTSVLYLASRETQHHLRVGSRIGRRLPAHATSLGQALLAARPWEEVDRLLPAELVALSPQTITDREALRAALETTRSHGWAREVGQSTPGLTCFGMAIPRTDGPPTDALSVAIPDARVTPEHESVVVDALATAVLDIARAIRVH
jgi:DNA-binding IclR family transcriptional regulator